MGNYIFKTRKFVSFQINKHFSCSHEIVNSNWTSLLVYNHTKREISDIIPNTQYIIQVVPAIEGHNYKDHENILYVKTPNSSKYFCKNTL